MGPPLLAQSCELLHYPHKDSAGRLTITFARHIKIYATQYRENEIPLKVSNDVVTLLVNKVQGSISRSHKGETFYNNEHEKNYSFRRAK